VLVVVAVLLLPAPAAALDTDDPRRSQLWWFDVLGVEEAWETSRGDGVVVAVIDTGVQPDHEDLVGQLVDGPDGTSGRDLLDADAPPVDRNGHGTLVAGLIAAAADNGVGVAGVAPGARILPVRVLGDDGRGRTSTVDAGIRWAVDQGADVVNLSLEVEEGAGGPSAVMTAPNAAIEYAWRRGVVVVAATGNSGAVAAGYPTDSPVLLVGATGRDDQLATFSDTDRLDAVMAPGVDMVSTWCRPLDGACDPGVSYGIGDGTSFAAPVVSGVVALLLATGLDHDQAVTVLRDTAVDLGDDGPDGRFGVGRVDAAAALAAGAALVAAGPADPPNPAPSPPPERTAVAEPSGADPGAVVDVPATASPAPLPGDVLADARRTEPDPPPAALVAVAVALLLAAAVSTARAATGARRRRR
jgi:subtilisin family serine protease